MKKTTMIGILMTMVILITNSAYARNKYRVVELDNKKNNEKVKVVWKCTPEGVYAQDILEADAMAITENLSPRSRELVVIEYNTTPDRPKEYVNIRVFLDKRLLVTKLRKQLKLNFILPCK